MRPCGEAPRRPCGEDEAWRAERPLLRDERCGDKEWPPRLLARWLARWLRRPMPSSSNWARLRPLRMVAVPGGERADERLLPRPDLPPLRCEFLQKPGKSETLPSEREGTSEAARDPIEHERVSPTLALPRAPKPLAPSGVTVPRDSSSSSFFGRTAGAAKALATGGPVAMAAMRALVRFSFLSFSFLRLS
jgi:hypothetical protein